MDLELPTSADWARRCAADGEFQLAARHWDGGLKLGIGEHALALKLDGGNVSDGSTGALDGAGVIEVKGDADLWERLLQPIPERFFTDLFAAMTVGAGFERGGDRVVHAQYYPAAMRAMELLRGNAERLPMPAPKNKVFDAPVGRYVHVELEGYDHRIYFEEAGQGIPVLLQHTAGCHGSQWRHLFEEPAITDHFRLIAYDLPYHGKSVPPVDKQWWTQKYDLKGDFLRAVPVQLARTLELERPVFIGCSVGGLLALDLAYRHPDDFRAVVSVEGALKIEGDVGALSELWHPQVSNEYKARAMEGLTAPQSPLPFVKETSFVYASGWPQAFLGDLYYYMHDFDLRNLASQIDTARCGVHILSGEYDYSGSSELGREAHAAIRGSTWTEMKGVGHFPMSENPEAFIRYLLPQLEQIRAG